MSGTDKENVPEIEIRNSFPRSKSQEEAMEKLLEDQMVRITWPWGVTSIIPVNSPPFPTIYTEEDFNILFSIFVALQVILFHFKGNILNSLEF